MSSGRPITTMVNNGDAFNSEIPTPAVQDHHELHTALSEAGMLDSYDINEAENAAMSFKNLKQPVLTVRILFGFYLMRYRPSSHLESTDTRGASPNRDECNKGAATMILPEDRPVSHRDWLASAELPIICPFFF